MSPFSAKTFSRQDSPAKNESTRASMAEKSETMNLYPSLGTNAVRMSSDRTSGTESYSAESRA